MNEEATAVENRKPTAGEVAENPRLAAALEALGSGFTPIPIAPGKKKPALIKWKPLQEHPPEEEEVCEWWTKWPNANLAIATGSASGLAVLDFDPGHEKWPPAGCELPAACVVRTPRGGEHRYFKHVAGLRSDVGEGVRKGVDVRAGGGYVLVPPSTVNGKPYTFLHGSLADALECEAPVWLVAALRETKTGGKAPPLPEKIPEGERNSQLISLGGSMRQRGASQAAILEALRVENTTRCKPPLDDVELQNIAKSVARYEPVDAKELREEQFPRSESGDAELLVRLYNDTLRYDYRRKRWLLWKKHWWRDDDVEEVLLLAKETARFRQRLAFAIKDDDKRTKALAWAFGGESRRRRENMLRLARLEPPISDDGENWDKDPSLVGVSNGVVDLRRGELRDGRQADRITRVIPFDFDPTAQCPGWEKFLDEIFGGDEKLVEFIHLAVGYSLTGDTSEEILFILYGTGWNGKSVFLRTLSYVFGPYAWNAAFTTFELRGRSEIPHDLAGLDGARFVTASETNEGRRLNEARIKSLTGRDLATARFMYEREFTFMPVCKIWLGVNHKPVIRDDSLGFWRRIRLVPFEQSFKGEAEDKTLDEKLKAEAPGILAWAVGGAVTWREKGLTFPEKVKLATTAYEEESDPLAEFLEECCILEAKCKSRASVLYAEYQRWSNEYKLSQRSRLGPKQFSQRMVSRFTKKKESSGIVYHGVGVLVEAKKEPKDTPAEDTPVGEILAVQGCSVSRVN